MCWALPGSWCPEWLLSAWFPPPFCHLSSPTNPVHIPQLSRAPRCFSLPGCLPSACQTMTPVDFWHSAKKGSQGGRDQADTGRAPNHPLSGPSLPGLGRPIPTAAADLKVSDPCKWLDVSFYHSRPSYLAFAGGKCFQQPSWLGPAIIPASQMRSWCLKGLSRMKDKGHIFLAEELQI